MSASPRIVTKPMVLDLGCGGFKLPGAIGLDFPGTPGVDIAHDMNRYPWPIADSTVERVVCRHSLAHVADMVRAMEEIHRITVSGGMVEITTPHFSSDNAFTDVTSRRFFGYRSFDYFCQNGSLRYRYGRCDFRLLERRISFVQAKAFPDQPKKTNPFAAFGLEWAVNRAPRFYEHFLAFYLRANELYFRLETVKP